MPSDGEASNAGTMRVYHTCASSPDMERARSVAPSYEHGYGWLPYRMSKFDDPWFLDNGAYTGAFEAEEFVGVLATIDDRMPRPPEFVVLPDIYQDGGASLARSASWAGVVQSFGYDYYLPIQDGVPVEEGVRAAVELDAAGIFIGGSDPWMREYAGQLVMTAHDYGLEAHIGKPGKRLTWARDLGVDSVDTASIVRNGYWDRLRKLEAAEPTEEVTLADAAE